MRWKDDKNAFARGELRTKKEVKRYYMSQTSERNNEAEKWFRRKPYSKEEMNNDID